jgi:hypothetical protein
MHVRRSVLGWGVFLILAGAVPLAARAGYLTDDQIERLWQLWPLILIGIGTGVVLSRTRFGLIGGLIVAATFGLMVGGLLSGGLGTVTGTGCGVDSRTAAFPNREGLISNTGTVSIDLACGDLTLATQAGDGWRVAGRDSDGSGPSVYASNSSLGIATTDDRSGPFWLGGGRESWTITLPQAPTLDVDLRFDAGTAMVDLDGAALGRLSLRANAGRATLDLGSTRQVNEIDLQLNAGSLGLTLPDRSLTGSIRANAGAVRICVPAGVALRLTTGGALNSYAYGGSDLVQDGSTWSSPGFDNAQVRIDLETIANAGSFTLDPEDGCG